MVTKDERVIHTAIQLPGVKDGKRYTPGKLIDDPDELAAAGLSKEDMTRLEEKGAISGFVKVKPEEKKK